MEIIAKGAEATIYKTKLFNKEVCIKERNSKKYRHPVLDTKILKTRNKEEAFLLKKIQDIGLFSPYIYSVSNNKIIMEYIKNSKKHKDKLEEIGIEIAKLHNNNIIHGDLNLINILTNNNKVYFIDFGLGYVSLKIEDKATDLLVFKKTLLALKRTEKLWVGIKEGYLKGTNNKNIIKHIENIEKRGRYL
jgi:Kae1-associated kinase Bud32